MIKLIDRKLFFECIGKPEKRKALALAVFIKTVKPASVIKDWSYRGLSELTGLCYTTLRKRIATLREMGLVWRKERHGHTYLIFPKLRIDYFTDKSGRNHSARWANIEIGKINFKSIRSIERGLMAMLIVEVQRRKDYIEQRVKSWENPRTTQEYNSARRFCYTRGINQFIDNGFSYEGIARRLRCGFGTVSKVIRHGEWRQMFVVERQTPEKLFIGPQNAALAAGSASDSYYHNQYLYYYRANRFSLNIPH